MYNFMRDVEGLVCLSYFGAFEGAWQVLTTFWSALKRFTFFAMVWSSLKRSTFFDIF